LPQLAVDEVFGTDRTERAFQMDLLWAELDALRDQIALPTGLSALDVSFISLTLVATAGFVFFALTENAWLASALLTAAPLWKEVRQYDPLALLDAWEKEPTKSGRGEAAGQEETLQSFVG
jgi:hypothetical protein